MIVIESFTQEPPNGVRHWRGRLANLRDIFAPILPNPAPYPRGGAPSGGRCVWRRLDLTTIFSFLHIYVNTTHICSESGLRCKEIGKPSIQVTVH
jgi:hypothetical protein